MIPVNLILGVTYAAIALLVVGLAMPLRRGAIPPNGWYGVRIRKSLASDENWYAINRFGADQLIVYGVELFVVGVAVVFVPLASRLLFWLVILAPLILMVPTMIRILRFAAQQPD